MQAIQNRKRIPILTQLLGICALAATPPANPTTFDASFSGSQVVPSVSTTGTGTLNATTNGTTLTVAGDVNNLLGLITNVNLYCGAATGVNVNDLSLFTTLSFSNSSTTTGTGTVYGTINGGTQTQFDLLKANQCYIVVFTKIGSNLIAPEVRGQIIKRGGS
jgi:hypothetical protein